MKIFERPFLVWFSLEKKNEPCYLKILKLKSLFSNSKKIRQIEICILTYVIMYTVFTFKIFN
jgi:hypothetical protein